MATVANSLVDNSLKDDTGDDINGAEVDANPNTIASILDGDTATALNQSGAMVIRSFEATDASAAGGGVRTALHIRHDPVSGTVTDNDGVEVLFEGDDDAGNKTTFAELEIVFTDVSDGSEDASLVVKTMSAGTSTAALTINPTTVTVAGALAVGVTTITDGTASGETADVSADALVIDSNGTTGLSILSGASDNGSIFFGSSTNVTDGRLQYSHTDRVMSIYAANAAAAYIGINGFGTGVATTPAAGLHAAEANNEIVRIQATGSTSPGWVQFEQGSTTRGFFGFQNSVGTGIVTAGIANAMVLRGDAGLHLLVNSTGPSGITIDTSVNVGVGTTTFGTSAAGTLHLANGTQASTAAADTVSLVSEDLSAGNTILSLRCEGSGVLGSGNPSQDTTIALKVNGTVYYLLASTAAS